MTTLVSKELEKVLKENDIKGDDISNVKKYIEALRSYEALVSSGLTTPRGNNLISKEKALNSSIRFNMR